MKSPQLSRFITSHPITGSDRAEGMRYVPPSEAQPGQVYVNHEQCFAGVPPEVWETQIGGYRVLKTWLGYRQGRVLSREEIDHFQKVAVALQESLRLVEPIGDGEPLAVISRLALTEDIAFTHLSEGLSVRPPKYRSEVQRTSP